MSLFTEIQHILFGAKISQMPLLTEMENKNVVICGDEKRNMPLFTYVFAQMECENVVIYGDTAHSFRRKNTQMSLLTVMKNKNVVICGDGKRNMPLFTYVFAQMECENVVIYGDTAHSFRSQNTQMSLLTDMENKNVVICGDVKRNMPLFTYVFAQMECENVVMYGDTAHSFRCQNTQMWLLTEMENKNVVICGYVKRNISLFTYVLDQMDCENVLIYGDTAHSFRSQNTQMWLLTEMENKNVVICGDVQQKMPLLTYVFAQMECKNVVIYGDTAHSFRNQNTEMKIFTEVKNKNVVICRIIKKK